MPTNAKILITNNNKERFINNSNTNTTSSYGADPSKVNRL